MKPHAGSHPGPKRPGFARSTIQTVSVRFMLLVAGMGTGVILARWLGPEGVGIYALLLLMKDLSYRFSNLGLGMAIAFFIARRLVSARRLLPLACILAAVLSGLSLLALLLVWREPWSPWHNIRPFWFFLALPTVPVLFFRTFFERFLKGQLHITAVNLADMTGDFSQFPLLGIFVILLDGGLTGAILALVIGDSLRMLFLAGYLFRFRAVVVQRGDGEYEQASTPRLLGGLLHYGKWQYLFLFANFLVEDLPLILVKSLTMNDALVGFYSRARALGRQTRLMTMPVTSVLFPFTAASEESVAVRRTNILCRNMLLVTTIGVSCSCLVAEPVIVLLYGSEFRPSVPVFYALAPGVILWPFGRFLATHLLASGEPKRVFFASIPTLLIGGTSCWVLTTRFGILGAGWGASIMFAIDAFVRLLQYRARFGVKFRDAMVITREDIERYRQLPELIKNRGKRKKAKTRSESDGEPTLEG
ncbi:MAG: lipopolysaccharide biosynthesis protein [Candidatus Sumerlaeia bacterium]|nr:lipopolysaccharide biosynthesis protein [Candidatus Sumerlaeia bacterium]